MSESTMRGATRRGFLGQAAALAGAMPLASSLLDIAPSEAAASTLTSSPVDSGSGYRSLSPDEAAFTEALVDALCPADRLTPNGAACGLALAIDRLLAGDFGRDCARAAWESANADSYAELPLTQEQFFKAGVAAANRVSRERYGMSFDRLPASEAARFVSDMSGGGANDAELPLETWYKQLVDPLLVRASFSGHVYDEHNGRVFWKLFG